MFFWSLQGDLRPSVALTKGVHRSLCFGGVALRHTGDAPVPPRWQRGVLLVDECRLGNGRAGGICTRGLLSPRQAR